MTAKKINLKDYLINNGIIVVLVLLAIFTVIKQPSFGTVDHLKNIALNVAPRFIIACGVSGCLITRGTDLSCRTYCRAFCLSWQGRFCRTPATAVNSSPIFRILESGGYL